jgi:spermidine/putrescine transport system ATP-binding protein
MNAGRMEQIGAPQEVYEFPATEFVASFLGASNLLEGDIEGTNDSIAKIRLRSGVVITAPTKRLPAASGEVRVGVRPEKLTIVLAGDQDLREADNSIDATVTMSTYTGVGTTYQCQTDGDDEVTVYVQNISTALEPIHVGERIRLSWHSEHTFVVKKGNGHQ